LHWPVDHRRRPIVPRIAEDACMPIEHIEAVSSVNVGDIAWSAGCEVLGAERNRPNIRELQEPLRMQVWRPVSSRVAAASASRDAPADQKTQRLRGCELGPAIEIRIGRSVGRNHLRRRCDHLVGEQSRVRISKIRNLLPRRECVGEPLFRLWVRRRGNHRAQAMSFEITRASTGT
jgi:hypothetical protein